ncbi:hypothetical protein KGF54_005389 [Candida jiufengensis]|uniref:uncharacterized protein n=1 Tax=Candida jiufengensis TaxID=497108 RepID=UPI00222401DA|nr:uncharacterized protein KGF54_005389 [Candida jiufengensis]KAI5949911.1 hypothetical protein KGF54_005389 [Candida jiufengensis]
MMNYLITTYQNLTKSNNNNQSELKKFKLVKNNDKKIQPLESNSLSPSSCPRSSPSRCALCSTSYLTLSSLNKLINPIENLSNLKSKIIKKLTIPKLNNPNSKDKFVDEIFNIKVYPCPKNTQQSPKI